MLTFNKKYFVLASLIFIVEVWIAIYTDHNFVRSYLGDVLVVILIYCFLKAFIRVRVLPLALSVLLFSFFMEFLQSIKFVQLIGLEKSPLARTVLGTSFAWLDLAAYLAGIAIVVAVEKYRPKRSPAEEH